MTDQVKQDERSELFRKVLKKALCPSKHYYRPHKTNSRSKRIRRVAWLIAVFWSRRTAWRYLFSEWRREVFYMTWNHKRLVAAMTAPLKRMRNYTAMGRAIFKEEPLEAS